ncbi:MAG TPA: TraB/GumN family protein [Steroidobacteraceae bacterium]|nr:TraB/GumN family protein [Steroidobacteraceae bacterium]
MRYWLLALCFLGSLSARAQSPVWALHGAHGTVYLAESVHLLKPGQSRLPDPLSRAYADSSELVMELDLAKLDPGSVSAWMLAHGRYPDGESLQSALGAERYAKVEAQAAALGLPLQQLAMLRPWVAALTLTDLMYLKLGYQPDAGVEEQLIARARQDNRPTAGLETLDEELGQLEHLSPEDQARFLELTLADLKDTDDETDQLLAAWRAGNTAALAAELSDAYNQFPELYRLLVSERNRHWLPRIRAYLNGDRNVLIVVGALHVVGKGGLLDLLKEAGIAATPVLTDTAPLQGANSSRH